MTLRTFTPRLAVRLAVLLAVCAAGATWREAGAAGTVTTEQLMRWAQLTYPALFPDSPPIVTVPYAGQTYAVRGYVNGNYLGVSNGRIYGLGPFTNQALADFGEVASYADQVCATLGCGNTLPDSGAVDNTARVNPPSPASISARVTQHGQLGPTLAAFRGTLSGNVTALGGSTIYVIVEDPSSLYTAQASLSVGLGTSGWEYTMQLHPRPLGQVGRFTGALRVFACLDSQCHTRLAGTPVSIPYDVTVTGAASPGH